MQTINNVSFDIYIYILPLLSELTVQLALSSIYIPSPQLMSEVLEPACPFDWPWPMPGRDASNRKSLTEEHYWLGDPPVEPPFSCFAVSHYLLCFGFLISCKCNSNEAKAPTFPLSFLYKRLPNFAFRHTDTTCLTSGQTTMPPELLLG